MTVVRWRSVRAGYSIASEAMWTECTDDLRKNWNAGQQHWRRRCGPNHHSVQSRSMAVQTRKRYVMSLN